MPYRERYCCVVNGNETLKDVLDKETLKESVREHEKSCDKPFKVNVVVLAPYYPAIENQHNKEVVLVKNEVSGLKKGNFG